MTTEKAIEILSDVGDINRCCAEDAEALDMAIKALEQQSCEDAISRQALIEKATSWDKHFADSERCVSLTDIQNAPSVTPQPKIGKWIVKEGFDGDEYYDCSECGESFCLIDGTPTDNLYNYCPNCGTKLTELKPS